MHQKTKLKIISLFVSLLFLLILIPTIVTGDGGAWRHIPDIDSWASMDQEKQIGIINFKDGYEKLILVISVKNSTLQGDRAVWIFPVPSDPNNVNIDILDSIPQLDGTEINDLADDAVNDPYYLMYFSQPYIVPFGLFYYIYIAGGMIASSGAYYRQYEVYEHVEKKGMTTEKVRADDSTAFQSYLQSNNLSFPQETNTIIDEYIGQNYCFIVSWISSVEEFRNESLFGINSRYYFLDNGYIIDKSTNTIIGTSQNNDLYLTIGVSIDFPTEKIYYPLKLTSVYGSKSIPIFIQIIDYVTPTRYPDFSGDGFIETNYYIDKNYNVPTNLTNFFVEQIEHDTDISFNSPLINDIKYTQIEIYSKAEYLTDDLYIDDVAPIDVSIMDFLANNGCIILIVIFVLFSCLSSLLAGLIVYGKQKPIFYKFALLGLSNFASLVGFFIASFALKIDKKFVKTPVEKIESNIKNPIKSILLSTIIILLIIVIIILPFSLNSISAALFSIIISILFCLPIILTVAILIYGRSKDKQKTFFIILFSINFTVFLLLMQFVLQIML